MQRLYVGASMLQCPPLQDTTLPTGLGIAATQQAPSWSPGVFRTACIALKGWWQQQPVRPGGQRTAGAAAGGNARAWRAASAAPSSGSASMAASASWRCTSARSRARSAASAAAAAGSSAPRSTDTYFSPLGKCSTYCAPRHRVPS